MRPATDARAALSSDPYPHIEDLCERSLASRPAPASTFPPLASIPGIRTPGRGAKRGRSLKTRNVSQGLSLQGGKTGECCRMAVTGDSQAWMPRCGGTPALSS
jgi:hypothetical protein